MFIASNAPDPINRFEGASLFGINESLTETFSNYQTIQLRETVSTEYQFGNNEPNGIPYIGGVYQLLGEYSITPGLNMHPS